MVLFVGAFDELVLYPESHFEGLALAWILNTRIPYFLKVCFIFYVLRIATPDIFFPKPCLHERGGGRQRGRLRRGHHHPQHPGHYVQRGSRPLLRN